MPEPTIDVVCVGNAIVDVLTHGDDAFLATHGMTKGAMQLIEADEATGLYAAMGAGVEASGGSAGNTAAGLASLGSQVAFIGKVADDVLGEVFTHDIRALGVRFDPPPPPPDGPATARCLIVVTPDAERTLNTYLGISNLISPDDIDDDLVRSGSVLYCEGYLWDTPDAKAALGHAMDIARSAGRKVAFTLSDAFCVDRHREDFVDLANERVDILFANESEICSLYEVDDFDVAAKRVAGHCEIACLTRSEKGSVVITDQGDRFEVPAAGVERVVDTTGAGDLYAAGFLHAYTSGRDLTNCAALGGLAAAEVISHIGARPESDLRRLAKSAGFI